MTVALTPMAMSEIPDWLTSMTAEYVSSRQQAGESFAEAQTHAELSLSQFFPQGTPIEKHLVFNVSVRDETVGYLWIGPQLEAGDEKWWVWDIEIYKTHQRNGYGREVMLMAEAEAKRNGATELGLNVFGYNTPARALYESLGYEPTSIRMAKKP